MRTNIVIDDELMEKAMKSGDFKTKKEVVETGLKFIIKLNQQKKIRHLKGSIEWKGNLSEMRTDK